ncbi:MAG: histidine kinase [Bacteroidota bacterium]
MNEQKLNKTIAYLTLSVTIIMCLGVVPLMSLGELEFIKPSTTTLEPAGYSFLIWYFIYIGFLGLGFYQAHPSKWYDLKFIKARPYIIINGIANNMWLLFVGLKSPLGSLLCTLIVLITLIRMSSIFELGKPSKNRQEKYRVKIPLALYFGWITLLIPISVSMFLQGLGDNPLASFFNSELGTVVTLVLSFLVVIYLFLRQKVSYTYVLVVIWGLFGIFISNYQYSEHVSFTALGLAVGLLVTYFIVERQQIEMDKIQTELTALRNQINPHFLFNNLNTLANLIPMESENAHSYLNKLAKFYRYIVQQNDSHLIPLSKELKGVQHYIDLLQVRFGKDLEVEINCDHHLHKAIPPLSLQLLLENAVKHNAISEDEKLKVAISCVDNGNYLKVENNINERIQSLESTGIGLSNILQRYRAFSKKKVQIQRKQQTFSVALPLIDLG